MFGKPEWFRESKVKWALVPRGKQGWAYYGTWAAVVFVPMILMRVGNLWPESFIWMAVAALAFAADFWRLAKDKSHQEELANLHYIDDPGVVVHTKNYDLEIDRSK